MRELILVYLHYFSLFAAFSLLVTELAVLQLPPQPGRWRFMSHLDIGYFVAAIGVLATGLGRILLGLKPALYYWHDTYFHALWITYLFIGLLSIVPTVSFIRWAKAERGAAGFAPPIPALRHVRDHIVFELLLFCLAPIFAILMARGYGA